MKTITQKEIKNHTCYKCMFCYEGEISYCGVNGVPIRFPNALLSPYYVPEWCPIRQGDLRLRS